MVKMSDLIFSPLRFLLPHNVVNNLGLTSLKNERIKVVLPYIQSKLLDIGCGEGNELVKRYIDEYKEQGVGVDIYSWKGVDVICDTTQLPFPNEHFGTVTIVATLNHIIEREKVLIECYRVLKKEGLLLITMISPFVGFFRHKLTSWWDIDQEERGMTRGEEYGLSRKRIEELLDCAGFVNIKRIKFLYGLNNLYIGRKR